MIQTHPCYFPIYTNKDKFIILVTGGRGCEAPDTPIMMADLTIKQIKDIKVGDKVMGDDGKPRNVLCLYHGISKMYRVHQANAEDYVVNDSHKLVLKKGGHATRDSKDKFPQYEDIIELPIEEYISECTKRKDFVNCFYGYKCDSIPYPQHEVRIPPYILGLWIGDGTAMYPRITNPDIEVVEALQQYCDTIGLTLVKKWEKGAWHMGLVMAGGRGHGNIGGNEFLNSLNAYNLISNKHIPQEYISNSEHVRLELLAGLLDTDGNYSACSYEITQKNESLARQIKFLADTLGFRTSIKEKSVNIGGGRYRTYYRLMIGGDLWRIPCRVKRKVASKEQFNKTRDWRKSKLTVTPLDNGEYCGIGIDGNHRYLAGDGTVKRNSGKSFSVSTFIERLTFEVGKLGGKMVAHQILYARYTMVSAEISVIPEFMEKVEIDGTQKYFRSTKSDVVNKMTGSHIMFRGIKTSSGVQTAKLKSIKGLSVFVCDEGEEWTSEKEFETIMFSIRQLGLRNLIFIIMNPTDSNHFIYQKYIKDTHKIVEYDGVPVQISTHPNVLHIHTSYLDNLEHLNEQFLREAEEMKRKNPERYAHVFMGQWADVKEGAVFKETWGIVDEFPSTCRHVAKAMDWGYTNDPTTCVKCGIWNNDLYLDEMFYETGMLSSDIIRKLKEEDGHLFVYADSADPRLIDEVALGGIVIYGASKPAGSIQAGIDKIKTFDHVFVTKRSTHLIEEKRNYVWAKDKDGNYLNEPEDHDNHCLDPVRYYITGKILGQVVKSKAKPLDKSDLGIY